MNDQRSSRLEDRVERLDGKIDAIKDDVAELRTDLRVFTIQIEKHVMGDEKIITEIVPVLSQLKVFLEKDLPQIQSIIFKEEARKLLEKETLEKRNKQKVNLAIIASIVSITLGAIYKLYQMGIIKF